MDRAYQRDDIFEDIEKVLFCAEDPAQYGEEKFTPFYYNRQKGIKLFHGDSLVLLKRVPEKCIDMIFTDLPL